jgi:hypothetical protein
MRARAGSARGRSARILSVRWTCRPLRRRSPTARVLRTDTLARRGRQHRLSRRAAGRGGEARHRHVEQLISVPAVPRWTSTIGGVGLDG